MNTFLMPQPKLQFQTVLGTPLIGGKLYTYAAGTTDPKDTYSAADGSTKHTNPIVLNARGEPPAAIYWNGNYRIDLRDALGNLVYTVDNYNTDPGGFASILPALSATSGAGLVGVIQAGAGAVASTLQDEVWRQVFVEQFGAVAGAATDQGPAILAAHTYATSIGAELLFCGEYLIGAGTSFTIDPTKTRWRARGPSMLRWSAAPVSGVAVNIVSSEATPYETVRRQLGRVIDGLAIVGSQNSGALFAATGLRIGNDVNHTNSFTLSHVTVSGWTIVEDFRNNVWWITHDKCRLMWGAINTPAVSGNWGENNSYRDCELLDGLTMTINYGEWRFSHGSIDNTQLLVKNNATVSGLGVHFENPGTTTLTRPFVDIQGTEARVHLVAPEVVINNAGAGSPITTAPFNVISTNTLNGLILDGVQYTQGGAFQWYSFVSGGGRVVIRNPQILAFSNFNFQVMAENTRGQLRNYGFEAGDMSGWTVTANASFGTSGTATVGTTRVRPGSTGTKSCQLNVTHTASVFGDSEIAQTFAVQAGELVQYSMAISRQYTSAPGQYAMVLTWLDAAGATISTVSMGYAAAGVGTDDGATFNRFCYNAIAPGGTVRATLKISFQSPNTIGTTNLYVDDVFVNVI